MRRQTQTKPRRSRGFTVVDLSIVCAAAILLMLLIVPAVQAARRSARLGSCKNNLKQIGLALHNYHDVHQVFPPGWVTPYQDANSPRGYGWQVFILPYMDEANLFKKLNFESEMGTPDTNKLLAMSIDDYLCPTSDAPKTNVYRGGYATSSYSGNYGSFRPPRWGEGRIEAFWPGAVPASAMGRFKSRSYRPGAGFGSDANRPQKKTPPANPYGRIDGLFSWNSSARIRDVTDGMSHTLMVSERGKRSAYSIWAGVGSNRFESDAVTDASHQSRINKSFSGYSSEHGGGIYLVLVDGSTKWLSDEVESKPEGGILQAIASRDGGEVISGDVMKRDKVELW